MRVYRAPALSVLYFPYLRKQYSENVNIVALFCQCASAGVNKKLHLVALMTLHHAIEVAGMFPTLFYKFTTIAALNMIPFYKIHSVLILQYNFKAFIIKEDL